MKSISLRNKLVALSAAAVIGIVLTSFVGVRTIQTLISSFTQITDADIPIIETLDTLKIVGARLISSANETILDESLNIEETEEGDEVQEIIAEYGEAIASYRALARTQPTNADVNLDDIETAGSALVSSTEQVLRLVGGNTPTEEVVELRATLEDNEEQFLETIDHALDAMKVRLEESELAAEQTSASAQWLVTGAAAIIAGLVGGIALLIARVVFTGLQDLGSAAEQISKRNWSARSNVTSRDELGRLGTAFNEMATAIEEQIRETEAARQKAEQSDRVKSAFLASMSHELRTPLNSVINLTRFVVDGDTGPINEQQKELLTDVVGSGKHLLTLINDVLDMSKIEARSLNLFVEENIQVASLLETALSTARSLLFGKPVRLHAEISDNIPALSGDRQRILQILLNVLSNACKFTDEGEIRVRAYQEDEKLHISIADTGAGIAPDDQALVFLPFQQTKSGLRQGGGTGLGMPIAKSLTEAHGGHLWLESTYGQGSTFHISLPLTGVVAEAAAV